MPTASRTIRVFVSSTFEDFREERDALRQAVFEPMRELCHRTGYAFQAVDLRWGISADAADNNETLAICLQEIARCWALSERPFFIGLVGQRYGWRPLPSRIPAAELDHMFRAVALDDAAEIARWYRLDDNAVPPENCLLPRRHAGKAAHGPEPLEWPSVEARLRRILQQALAGSDVTEDRRAFYSASATEHEIETALRLSQMREHVAFFVRDLVNLDSFVASDGQVREPVRRFVDCDESGRIDAMAQARLGALRKRLSGTLVEWCPAVLDRAGNVAGDSVRSLCTRVAATLQRLIEERISRDKAMDPLARELEVHVAERQRHLELPCRQAVVDRVLAKMNATSEHGPALVVFGPDAAANSAVLARAYDACREQAPSAMSVYRVLGCTVDSSDRTALFASVAAEIDDSYGGSTSTSDGHRVGTPQNLENALRRASPARPLLVFFDGLDALADFHPARDGVWLTHLPQHVRVVLSVQRESRHFAHLLTSIGGDRMIAAPPLSRSEAGRFAEAWLAGHGRRISAGQLHAALSGLGGGDVTTSSLALMCGSLARLRSFDTWNGGTPEAQFQALFTRLEAVHGPHLVDRALGYLTAAGKGLSEEELFDLIRNDRDIIHEFNRTSPHARRVTELPFIAWARLQADLDDHLRVVSHDGFALLGFVDRSLWHVAARRFLDQGRRKGIHSRLAAYFRDQSLFRNRIDSLYGMPGLDRAVALDFVEHVSHLGDRRELERVVNVRKVVELPHALLSADAHAELAGLLGDLAFAEAYRIVQGLESLTRLWQQIEKKDAGTILRVHAPLLKDPSTASWDWVGTNAILLLSCGHFKESLILEDYLARDHRNSGRHLPLAANLMNQAHAHFKLGDSPRALALYEESAAVAGTAGRPDLAASAVMHRGVVLEEGGDLDGALRAYAAAEAVFRREGVLLGLAQVLDHLSVFEEKRGNLVESERASLRSAEIHRQAGPDPGPLVLDRPLGPPSDLAAARARLDEAGRMLAADRVGEGLAMMREAELLGRFDVGRADKVDAIVLRRIVAVLDNAARQYAGTGNHAAAIAVLERLEELHVGLGDQAAEIVARSTRGILLVESGAVVAGRELLKGAYKVATNAGLFEIAKDVASELVRVGGKR